MGVEAIIERILSDAEAESKAIAMDGEQKAAEIVSAANSRAEKVRRETEADIAEKRQRIVDRKAATARLDAAKIALEGKRQVVDAIYALAKKKLLELPKEKQISLLEELLLVYAEPGDEVMFSENFAYAKELSALPVFAQRNLTVSSNYANFDGGMMLIGRVSDKNLSYDALLAADREQYQSSFSAELFQ